MLARHDVEKGTIVKADAILNLRIYTFLPFFSKLLSNLMGTVFLKDVN